MAAKADPYEIRFDEGAIADLRVRLARTRFASDHHNDDWHYGVPTAVVERWVKAWQAFDFHSAARNLNRFENFRVELEGQPIHFIYCRGRGPASIPIILTHGWPWTFWDWHATIGPLTDPAAHGGDPADCFDVVVPSLPGFGFSTPLTAPAVSIPRTAELWLKLMSEVLGYDKFAAAGGDIGNLVTAQLGHKYADRLVGIHLLGAVPLAAKGAGADWTTDWGFPKPDGSPLDPVLASLPTQPGAPPSAHRLVHTLEPQTLAHALHDSPAGMLAWLLKARHFWSDSRGDVLNAFSEDFLLTTFSIYWLTESMASSMRLYRASADTPWEPSHTRMPIVETPTGITFFEYDQTSRSRSWAANYYNLIRLSYQPRGGHFSPAEKPKIVADEISATFRALRTR